MNFFFSIIFHRFDIKNCDFVGDSVSVHQLLKYINRRSHSVTGLFFFCVCSIAFSSRNMHFQVSRRSQYFSKFVPIFTFQSMQYIVKVLLWFFKYSEKSWFDRLTISKIKINHFPEIWCNTRHIRAIQFWCDIVRVSANSAWLNSRGDNAAMRFTKNKKSFGRSASATPHPHTPHVESFDQNNSSK